MSRPAFAEWIDSIKDFIDFIKNPNRMSEEKKEYKGQEVRMYSMVLRQLNPMQKGIQSLHAVVDFSEMIKDPILADEKTRRIYHEWANRHKTMIVLDAGTSADLDEVDRFLTSHSIPHCGFYEPDLYGMRTAICFLANDYIFDTKTYPKYEDMQSIMAFTDFLDTIYEGFSVNEYAEIMEIRDFIFSKKLSM